MVLQTMDILCEQLLYSGLRQHYDHRTHNRILENHPPGRDYWHPVTGVLYEPYVRFLGIIPNPPGEIVCLHRSVP